MRTETIRLLTMLDLYAPVRRVHGTPPEALQAIFDNADLLTAKTTELIQAGAAGPAKTNAIAGATASAMGASAAVVGAIPLGATQIAAAVIGIAASLVSGMTKLFAWECDKYECQKVARSYHRRALVGVSMPPGADSKSDGGCYWMGRQCSFIKYFNDGYVYDKPKQGDPNELEGTVIGVTSKTWGKHSPNRYKYWRNHSSTPKLSDSAWTERSSRVSDILVWMQDHIPCRQLKCMQDLLLSVDDFDARRRRGSRWYASIIQMMYDWQEVVRLLGYTQAIAVLDENGRLHESKMVREFVAGKLKDAPNSPVPMWSVTSTFDYYWLEGSLKDLVNAAMGLYVQKALKRDALLRVIQETDRQEFKFKTSAGEGLRIMIADKPTVAKPLPIRPLTQVVAPQNGGLMQLDFSQMTPADRLLMDYGTLRPNGDPNRGSFLHTTTGKLVLASTAATAAIAFAYYLRSKR